MVRPETADALTMAALAATEAQLELEDEEDEGEAANELGNIADRIEYWREKLAGAEKLSTELADHFTIRRRRPGD